VTATRFRSAELPDPAAARLRRRLAAAHASEPFCAVEVRRTVRRVAAIADEIGFATTIYRGGVGLGGWEADHVWLAVDGRVIDVAFPLFDDTFVDVLRRFVVEEASVEAVATAALRAGLDERVIGRFPPPVGYLGAPVWRDRSRDRVRHPPSSSAPECRT
jgi:hypothetical protein